MITVSPPVFHKTTNPFSASMHKTKAYFQVTPRRTEMFMPAALLWTKCDKAQDGQLSLPAVCLRLPAVTILAFTGKPVNLCVVFGLIVSLD